MTAKRALDVILAAVGLVLTAPLSAVVAGLIKMEDGGPAIFVQDRPGKGGKHFASYKFRTMEPESSRNELSVAASDGDPRVTRVGRVLRSTALDEIPQLWNILKGDMSFVGPRALPVAEVRNGEKGVERLAEVPGYEKRHSVRPGLTGLAQICASRNLDTRDKFRYDCLYIENRSLWLDLKLIFISLVYSLTGRWGE